MRIFLLIGFLRGYKLLKRLLERGESVVGVYVFEEDVHERAKYADDIESLCQDYQIPVKKTRRVSTQQAQEIEVSFSPDVIFCCGWRTLFPDEVLKAAARGVVGAHDSLLPRLRGFAPANWALILGHDEVGATLFRMTSGMDEGDVYFQESIPVMLNDTLELITDRIAILAISLFDKYLDAVRDGTLTAIPQTHARATYSCARTPDDGEIDWSATSSAIMRLVRGLGPPGPGAFTYYDRRIMRVLKATAVAAPLRYEGRVPGRVVAISHETIDVLSGDGVVRIEQVESNVTGVTAPTKIIKSVRALLGIRPSIEVARLYSMLADLQESIRHVQERMARIEAELPRSEPADHTRA